MNQEYSTDRGSRPERRRSVDRRLNTERRAVLRRGDFRKRSVATLAVLASLSTLVLILFFVLQSSIGDNVDWGKMVFMQSQPAKGFQIGDVALGISPETVRREHPNLDISSLVQNEKIATFNADGARYTIWFITVNGVEKAYRIRYDQVISGDGGNNVIDDIAKRYGRPGTSKCDIGAAGERNCHFQWWPSGGIALVVLSSAKKDNGKQVTTITTIATDTYLDGKRIRNLRR